MTKKKRGPGRPPKPSKPPFGLPEIPPHLKGPISSETIESLKNLEKAKKQMRSGDDALVPFDEVVKTYDSEINNLSEKKNKQLLHKYEQSRKKIIDGRKIGPEAASSARTSKAKEKWKVIFEEAEKDNIDFNKPWAAAKKIKQNWDKYSSTCKSNSEKAIADAIKNYWDDLKT